MDLLSLRYFQTVARLEHISRAAEELRVAQPSVSRTIARLEAELGVPLFDRQGRRVRLNRYGAAFLHRVDRALGELDDARRELADAAGLDHGGVAVAAETLLTVAGPLAAFRAAHPSAELRLFQSSTELMAQQLHTREVDFCLASEPLRDPTLCGVELAREEVLLAVPPGHRLAARARVTVRELADEPFITPRPGHWQRTLLDRLFATEGLSPVITCEGNEPAATQFLVSAGLGLGLMPAMARAAQGAVTDAPVGWLHVDHPDCHRTLTLAWRRDGYLSAAARRFRELVVEEFASYGRGA
ncbi:LysR family transcriptional regulator [Streptomyces sp. SAJ15]|uniref:LysR family transcriptional regulator n=1 Tax=Streptomyces sp. SAJ15 TaxID=2011095 RepID=UPI001185943C|nr:LysR family transcriptional regulator [Streptomyces sp. SAJ15]TVL91958.1 LysR family transcriptional regulator [Streptomyces sp. SAJ15]